MAEPADPEPTAEQGAVIDICNDGSLLKEITTPGAGDCPGTGYKVKCHYTGTLLDGSKFDSSRDRGAPFEFTIGEGVITGWSEGVATMKKGERAMFTIVADKAYGARGSPPKIPGGATLKFDIELLSFSPPPPNDVSLEKDLGVILTKVNPGEGWKKPAEFSKVTADLTVGLDETGVTVVEKHRVDFVLGHGEVLRGVEEGVLAMNKGETSVLRLEPKYAYGATGSPELGVPPAAVVNATVSLVDFENEKAPHELDSDAEKVGAINLRREAGNNFFRNKDYDRAVKRYKTALGVVPDYELKDASAEVRAALRPCHLNQAACFLKLGRASAANEACGKVLAEEPASVKALYRKGCALLDMGEYQDAKKTLKKCLATDPGNKGAIVTLKKVDAKIAADAKKAKDMFGGMFDRMAAADAQKSANKSKEPE